jgi:serine/threonine protein phosphatase Stp1
MTSCHFRFDWQAQTDRGSVRQLNEDTFAAVPERGIWLVADGMGGHEAGDWASQQITEQFADLPYAEGLDSVLNVSADAIHRANAAIYALAQQRGTQIGSTVVVLALAEDGFGVIWAGDSRAYLLRGRLLNPLTRDHTQVQAMVARGILSPAEAAGHPMSHVLAKAVGVEANLELEGFTDRIECGDLFLLCSDGLHGMLSDEQILQEITAGSFAESAERLIRQCLRVGARDNVTVVLVQAHEPTQLIVASSSSLVVGDPT